MGNVALSRLHHLRFAVKKLNKTDVDQNEMQLVNSEVTQDPSQLVYMTQAAPLFQE